jgi:dUTP pyrophosphatase
VEIEVISSDYNHKNPIIKMIMMHHDGFKFEPVSMKEERKVKYYLDEGGFEPVRGHFEDAGMDIRTPEDVVIRAHDSAVIHTKLHIEIPVGFYGKLESKSGLHVKHDIVCLGGTIDSGYTGEVVVKLYNLGPEMYKFKAGDKIVQMVIMPCLLEEWVQDDNFAESERGNGGFGSTGA